MLLQIFLLGGFALCSWNVRAASCTPITITNQPQSPVVISGCPATFKAGGTGTAAQFQWFRNGQIIAGATSSSYTISFTSITDNDARFRVTITNACSQTNSAEAVLYISLDAASPPYLDRAHGDATLNHIIASFAASCGGLHRGIAEEPFNYECTGGIIISNAVLDAAGTTVTLTTSHQTPGMVYTLTAYGMTDPFQFDYGDSEIQFQAWTLLPGSSPPVFVPPLLSVNRSSSNLLINWPPGSMLQQASQVTGPWTNLPDALNPHPATLTNPPHFYRALFYP